MKATVTTSFLLASLVAVTAFAQNPPPVNGTKPNIVFVLMDNLGYGEVGVYGGGITRGAPTPRIDTLATEGTRLTNFNVEAQCTPSRRCFHVSYSPCHWVFNRNSEAGDNGAPSPSNPRRANSKSPKAKPWR
jgi:arylsulfatase A-like enzyme